MARTVSEIYQQLVSEKNTQPHINSLTPVIDDEQTLLSDLTTPSKVAVWRLIFYIVAVALWIHETLWDLMKKQLEDIAAYSRPGTALWYQQEAFKFQFGDSLVWNPTTLKYEYAVIDATKQIIKRCAVVEGGGFVRIKVAKLVSGVLTPLTSAELAAFDAYINDIKFAGTDTICSSFLPDLLKLAYKIYYNPLVLAADGSQLSNPAVFPVEDAINNFISNLPFNGVFELSELVDAIQAASGVEDVIQISAEAKYGLLAYNAIVERYLPNAGYLIVDPLFPLNTQLTYQAYGV
ncbi:MAG: hypothetical protein V9G42_05940 [Bacteroidia bacterium]